MNKVKTHDLNAQDIDIFVSAIDQYFAQTTQEKPQIKAAYLGESDLPALDCTGAIEISGEYTGKVYYTAPIPLVRHLLTTMREPDLSMENIMDAVGEIANTLAGYSRQYYGEGLTIHPPIKTQDTAGLMKKRTREYPYVISIRWKQYQSALVIDIAPRN